MKIKIFPPEQTKYFPLYPSTVNISSIQQPIIREDGFDFHQLFLVTDGSGILNVDNKTCTLNKNDMFYLKNNIGHRYKGKTPSFSTTYISFFGNGFEGIKEYYNLGEYEIFKNKNTGEFKNQVEKLYKEIDSTDNLSRLCSLTFSVVLSFFEEVQKKESKPSLEQVVSFLEQNYNKNLTLNDILSVYPYSKTKLCRDFKNKYNVTIFEKVTDIRLKYAKFMIDENPKTKLSTVISACGFNDASYFCKQYKKRYGVSPKNRF